MVLDFGEKIAEGPPQDGDQGPRGQEGLHGHRGMSRAPAVDPRAGRPLRRLPGSLRDRLRDQRRRGRRPDRRERRRQVDLLKSIMGILRVAPDMVRFEGRPSAGRSRTAWCRKGVAIVPEGRRLFTGMSVEDNLRVAIDHAAPTRAGGWTLERVFDLFPMLREMRATPVQSLSGGQQQMVAIGRSLLNQPRVLLCDEISLGLAPKVVKEIYRSIPSISADRHRYRPGRAGCRPRPVGLEPALLHAGRACDPYRQIGGYHPRGHRRGLFRGRPCSGLTG